MTEPFILTDEEIRLVIDARNRELNERMAEEKRLEAFRSAYERKPAQLAAIAEAMKILETAGVEIFSYEGYGFSDTESGLCIDTE